MNTKQVIERMEDELIGYSDRGTVSYFDGLAVSGHGDKTPSAICNNCGFSAKGEEAKEMMFGHKNCPQPYGKYIKNSITAEKLESFIRSYTRNILKAFAEELIGKDETTLILKKTPETEFLIDEVPASEGRNRFRDMQRNKAKEIISSLNK